MQPDEPNSDVIWGNQHSPSQTMYLWPGTGARERGRMPPPNKNIVGCLSAPKATVTIRPRRNAKIEQHL